MVGEIDCREGILKAVQKGRYVSIETALLELADLYMALVREVRRRLPRGNVDGTIFLHPVANVLPETRFLTLAFNRLLASSERSTKLAAASARLLEFAPVFATGDPSPEVSSSELANLRLLSELELDGTHMSPAYVTSHLEPALSAAWGK